MKAIGIRVKRISCYAINDVENSEKLFAECVAGVLMLTIPIFIYSKYLSINEFLLMDSPAILN